MLPVADSAQIHSSFSFEGFSVRAGTQKGPKVVVIFCCSLYSMLCLICRQIAEDNSFPILFF
jgi:hypothetical protein